MEDRLGARINRVETGLNHRIDWLEDRLDPRIGRRATVPDGRHPGQRYSPVRFHVLPAERRDVGQEFARDSEPGCLLGRSGSSSFNVFQ